LTFGGDYRAEALQTDKSLFTTAFATSQTVATKPNGNVPNGDYKVTDAFAIASFRPLARLNVTVGMRFESSRLQSFPRDVDPLPPFTVESMRLNKRWNAATWNAGGVYNLAGGLSLVVNAATGYRAPTFSDTLSISVPVYASGVASVPSPDVRPERSLTAEGGLRFASRRLSFSATFYSNRLRDTLASVAVGSIAIPGVGVVTAMQSSNISRGYVRGFEAAFSLKLLESTTLFGNYAYTHGMDLYQRVPLRFIPPPFGTTGVAWASRGRRVHVEATMNLVDRMRTHAPQDEIDAGFSTDPGYGSPSATNPAYRKDFAMPGYAVANVRAGLPVWSRGRASFELSVALSNLFNQSYREAYSQQQVRAPGFNAVLGGRVRF
jgi:outer membrane receptor protein involved in Fe transport